MGVAKKNQELILTIVRQMQIDNLHDLHDTFNDLFTYSLEAILEEELRQQLQNPHSIGTSIPSTHSRQKKASVDLPREVKEMSEIESTILSLHAQGMVIHEIRNKVHEIYGIRISLKTITRFVERIQHRLFEWMNRPLANVYAFAYVDTITTKVLQEDQTIHQTVYCITAIDTLGNQDVLGYWIQHKTSSVFWLDIFMELRLRGVKKLLFVSADDIEGLDTGLRSTYPQAKLQRCMIHLMRKSARCISMEHYKEFSRDILRIYASENLSMANDAFTYLTTKWQDRYANAVRIWEINDYHIEQLFAYPIEIRNMVCSTTMMEGLHKVLRNVSNTDTPFQDDEAIMKALYLQTIDLLSNWTIPIQNWIKILEHMTFLFPNETA